VNACSTFERVYRAVRANLLRGAYRPGEAIESRQVGAELFASVTPVRDALYRLAGERLIEASPHDGFRVPLLTENALRDLIRWQEMLALTALRMATPRIGVEVPDAESDAERSRHIFRAIADLSACAELQIAMSLASDRLEAVRHLERRFLPDLDLELGRLEHALALADRPGLRHNLARYRTRRIRLVPDLLTTLMEGGRPVPMGQ
jgi:hypothetical protein